MTVELTLQRVDQKGNSTYGILFNHEQTQIAFVIEDIFREVKVDKETRIPKGRFKIEYREVLSPMTEKYRSKFDWFTWHLELQDVPDYQWCYLHIGNFYTSTEGCPLVNNGVQLRDGSYVGLDSTSCFKDVYKYVSSLLDSGEEVYITVRDEDYFQVPF